MTATGTLLGKTRLSSSTKFQRHFQTNNFFKPIHNQCYLAMSKDFLHELDRKMQQVREYGLITHGYQNENFQYPIHVRRSHDGEKLPRTVTIENSQKKTRLSNSTSSSSHDNRTTKSKTKNSITRQLSYDQCYRTLIVPPNKTVNDIHPSFHCDRLETYRKSSYSSMNSSPILCSPRPHSIAGITHDQQRNSLCHSSQSLIHQTSTNKTLTQRFFSKLFHHPSKS